MLPRKKDLNNSIFESVFLLMFSVIIIMNILGTSQLSEWSRFGQLNTIVMGASLGIIIITFFVFSKIEKRALIVGAVMIILCLLIRAQSDRGKEIIFFTAFAFFGAFVNRERFIKRYVIIATVTCLAIYIIYSLGLFPDIAIGRSDVDVNRFFLGFNYTNYPANYLFHICIAYFFIKKRGINLFETAIFLGLNIYIFILTNTQGAYYMMYGLIALLWIIRLLPSLFKYRYFKVITTWIMPVCAIGIALLTYLYSPGSSIMSALNRILTYRLSLGKQAMDLYGAKPFGTVTEWETSLESRDDGTYFYVDASYLNIAFTFGFVIIFFIIIGYMILGRQKHKERNYNACAALIFLALHSVTEERLFDPHFTPFVIFLGAIYIYKGRIPSYENTGDDLMENYQKNEREIRVRTLAWRVLKKWYIILIVAGIIGALATGYRIMRNNSNTGDATEVALAQQEYEKKLAEYNRNQETYKQTISDMEETLQSKLDYLSESELIKIDPNKEQLASVRMYFTSDGFSGAEAETDYTANKIIDYYSSFLTSGIDYTGLSEELGVEPVYLQELVSNGKDYATASFTINAKSNDPERSREILEYVIAQTDALYDPARTAFGNFDVQADTIRVNETIDSTLQNTINTKANEIKNLEASLKQIKQSLEKLDRPAAPAIIGRSAAIKDALMFGAKAFAAGIGAMIILMALIIIGRRRVLSADELNKTYNLKEVAVIKNTGDDLTAKYDIASENIKRYSGDAENILFVGDAPEKLTFNLMSEVQERLKDKTIDRVVKIDESRETLDKLKNSDAVVFVEKVGRSSYKLMDKNFDYIANWGKKIIGSVVF